ncbi:receptor-like protein kinase FERONIA [Camellia sinensis]|uniref:receptor-like protein kinase FERONIA n=1 Tax=Camellia sinensis TaxID=4442 RepID=UPI001036F20E|nr:receptor-like protein kinase FERONIA [Camellia sinensis]
MFKNVYKGCVDGETSIVMIKRFSALALRNWKEVRANIEVHSLFENHRHIVSLIGFCIVKPELIGVYDYMENGSLEDHLFNTNNDTLLWKERLRICIGAARGLQHLHENMKQKVIHCDIKPTNILLNKNWVAKLTHFGFSKLLPNDTTYVPLMDSMICRYMAPEYLMHGKLTTKSDIYSFGMVLLSVLCAKKPYYELDWDHKSLVCQFMNSIKTIDQIIDPNLIGKIAP